MYDDTVITLNVLCAWRAGRAAHCPIERTQDSYPAAIHRMQKEEKLNTEKGGGVHEQFTKIIKKVTRIKNGENTQNEDESSKFEKAEN